MHVFRLSSAIFLAKPATLLEKPAKVVQSLLLKQAYTVAKSSATQEGCSLMSNPSKLFVPEGVHACFPLRLHVLPEYNPRMCIRCIQPTLCFSSSIQSSKQERSYEGDRIRFQIREILTHNDTFISTQKAMSP